VVNGQCLVLITGLCDSRLKIFLRRNSPLKSLVLFSHPHSGESQQAIMSRSQRPKSMYDKSVIMNTLNYQTIGDRESGTSALAEVSGGFLLQGMTEF
jgi:hypothetical protein